MIDYDCFCKNCKAVEARIETACKKYSRERNEVSLLPVTKTHSKDAIVYAHNYGFKSIAENRVQEAIDKQKNCRDLSIKWEIIGHLQSNKAKIAASHFDRIQSVDSIKLATKLAQYATEQNRKLAILLQVNAGDDPAKFGVDCESVKALLDFSLNSSSLEVQGLMTIAPLDQNLDVARRCFMRLRETRDHLASSFAIPLPELSMGMSGDLEQAIEAGSTLIRIGTALFGSRESHGTA